ncbi:MAG TPA: SRPBCC family protein [Gemmataceae bacterium]|nr:SRPBCC family protein [Gemmataceae bacterium]
MGKKILIVLMVLVAILVVFSAVVAMQPADFRVVRSATISAPQADVFAQVNDFHKWEAWSPWLKLDPNATYTYEGPQAGTGAIFKWSGNSDAGEGMMKITESKPSDLIKIKLDFVRPFESTCNQEFTFKPEGNQTAVTWTMTGQNNFIGKVFCLFMNMDKTVGGDFEKGLANMKSVVEAKK